MSEELLRCPFCRGEVVRMVDDCGGGTIQHIEKPKRGSMQKCILTGVSLNDSSKTHNDWQSRPTPTLEVGECSLVTALENLLRCCTVAFDNSDPDVRQWKSSEFLTACQDAKKALLAAKTGGEPPSRALDEKWAFNLGAMFVRALQGDYDLVNYYAKEIQIDFKDGKPYCPTFTRPVVSVEEIQKVVAHNRHLLRKDIQDNKDTHKSLATAIHHLLEGKKG